MTNKKSQSTTSPSTAKSTPKTGKTSTDCITPKSDDIMKSDITPNSVDSAMPVEFHHIGASAARDGHSCFLRMCMIHKVMY